MERATTKPPWETVQFQTSPFATDTLLQKLVSVPFSSEWNEMTHGDLNHMKQQIEPLEQAHKWETLKKRTNMYELIYTQESSDCPPSLSLFKPLSRSFFKMIEILHVMKFYDRLPKQTQRLRSAHVAEGPGGFIEAFFHRAEGQRLTVQRALAMTLKPVNHHIPGWRRTFPFLHKHPEVKIYYGVDGTGNILEEQNQEGFIEQCANQRVHLFTGDGGFDFSIDYENQERTVFPLLVASALIGVQVLAADGCLVLKIFDCFSESTQYLIRILTLFFREWTLYKPAASRPCNSERYLLCIGFRSVYQSRLMDCLRQLAQTTKISSYPTPGIFPFFTEKEKIFLQEHIDYYHDHQIKILKDTIALQDIPSKEFSWKPHCQYSLQWCSYFRIPTISAKSIEASLA
jgi:hypothetical protein